MKKSNIIFRYLLFLIGLFVASLGVAFSTKAGLGTSPVSSIPYSVSLVSSALTFGGFLNLLSITQITVQVLLLRKKCKPLEIIIQTILAFVYGYLTNFSCALIAGLEVKSYAAQLGYMLLSCFVLGLGIWIQLKGGVAMLPGEAMNRAIAEVTGKKYENVKIFFDVLYIVISAVICLIALGRLEGVREGSIIAAILIGNIIRWYNKIWNKMTSGRGTKTDSDQKDAAGKKSDTGANVAENKTDTGANVLVLCLIASCIMSTTLTGCSSQNGSVSGSEIVVPADEGVASSEDKQADENAQDGAADAKETDSEQDDALAEPGQNSEDTSSEQDESVGEVRDPKSIWPAPVAVKGLYITGPMAGNAKMNDLVQLVEDTQLNTMVIDVKNDEGIITYNMDQEKVQAMNASISYVKDMPALIEELHAKGIYVIGRIVCFKDPVLAADEPALGLCKPNGVAVTDANGLAWVNPYKEEVWDYLCSLAEQAHADGFDEIQFDYVRFPIGKDANEADYGVNLEEKPRTEGLSEFFTYARERLHSQGILFGADLFGTVIGSEKDRDSTGQDYVQIASLCDNICPMIYPSHYANQTFGLAVPDAKPYETIAAAMKKSAEVLGDKVEVSEGEADQEEANQEEGSQAESSQMESSQVETNKATFAQQDAPAHIRSHAAVRPWLQCFTASWVPGHIKYGSKEVAAQIQAVEDAGIHEYILWHAANRYESVRDAMGMISPEQ